MAVSVDFLCPLCGVQLNDEIIATNLTLMFGWNDNVDQSAMANGVCLVWSCVEKGIRL